MSVFEVYEAIAVERERARDLRDRGVLAYVASEVLRLAALVEEVGEVARCLHDYADLASLRLELVQVAGVACSWVEAIDAVAADRAEPAT